MRKQHAIQEKDFDYEIPKAIRTLKSSPQIQTGTNGRLFSPQPFSKPPYNCPISPLNLHSNNHHTFLGIQSFPCEQLSERSDEDNHLSLQQQQQQENSNFLNMFKEFRLKRRIMAFLHELPSRRFKRLTKQHFNIIADPASYYRISQNNQYFKNSLGLSKSPSMASSNRVYPSSHQYSNTFSRNQESCNFLRNRLYEPLRIQCLVWMNYLSKIGSWMCKLEVLDYESTWKFLLDIIYCLSSLLLYFSIPLHVALNKDIQQLVSSPFLIISWTVLLFHILITLNTSYIEKGLIVSNRTKILQNYFHKCLLPDLFTFLPLTILLAKQLLVINQYTDQSSSYIHSDSPSQIILSWLFLFRVFQFQKVLGTIEERFHLVSQLNHIIQLLKLLFYLLFITHVFSCVWIYLGRINYEQGDNSWMKTRHIQESDWSVQYLQGFYFVTVTMISVGYGDIVPQTSSEIILCIVIMLISCGIFAYSLNMIGEILGNLYEQDNIVKQQVRIIGGYMAKNNINPHLRQQIRIYLEYYQRQFSEQCEKEEQTIISQLSDTLKNSLNIEAHKFILRESPIFSKFFSEAVLEKMVNIIKEFRCTPEQVIYQPKVTKEEEDTKIFFIKTGVVEIFGVRANHKTVGEQTQPMKKTSVKILNQGESFGEVEFFTGNHTSYFARSLEFSRVLYISRADFLELLKSYPQDYEKFCHIKDKMALLRDASCINLKQTYIFKEVKMEYKCYICSSGNHMVGECNLTHCVLNRSKVVRQQELLVPTQEREWSLRKNFKIQWYEILEEVREQAWKLQDDNESFIENASWMSWDSEKSFSSSQSDSNSKNGRINSESTEEQVIPRPRQQSQDSSRTSRDGSLSENLKYQQRLLMTPSSFHKNILMQRNNNAYQQDSSTSPYQENSKTSEIHVLRGFEKSEINKFDKKLSYQNNNELSQISPNENGNNNGNALGDQFQMNQKKLMRMVGKLERMASFGGCTVPERGRTGIVQQNMIKQQDTIRSQITEKSNNHSPKNNNNLNNNSNFNNNSINIGNINNNPFNVSPYPTSNCGKLSSFNNNNVQNSNINAGPCERSSFQVSNSRDSIHNHHNHTKLPIQQEYNYNIQNIGNTNIARGSGNQLNLMELIGNQLLINNTIQNQKEKDETTIFEVLKQFQFYFIQNNSKNVFKKYNIPIIKRLKQLQKNRLKKRKNASLLRQNSLACSSTNLNYQNNTNNNNNFLGINNPLIASNSHKISVFKQRRNDPHDSGSATPITPMHSEFGQGFSDTIGNYSKRQRNSNNSHDKNSKQRSSKDDKSKNNNENNSNTNNSLLPRQPYQLLLVSSPAYSNSEQVRLFKNAAHQSRMVATHLDSDVSLIHHDSGQNKNMNLNTLEEDSQQASNIFKNSSAVINNSHNLNDLTHNNSNLSMVLFNNNPKPNESNKQIIDPLAGQISKLKERKKLAKISIDQQLIIKQLSQLPLNSNGNIHSNTLSNATPLEEIISSSNSNSSQNIQFQGNMMPQIPSQSENLNPPQNTPAETKRKSMEDGEVSNQANNSNFIMPQKQQFLLSSISGANQIRSSLKKTARFSVLQQIEEKSNNMKFIDTNSSHIFKKGMSMKQIPTSNEPQQNLIPSQTSLKSQKKRSKSRQQIESFANPVERGGHSKSKTFKNLLDVSDSVNHMKKRFSELQVLDNSKLHQLQYLLIAQKEQTLLGNQQQPQQQVISENPEKRKQLLMRRYSRAYNMALSSNQKRASSKILNLIPSNLQTQRSNSSSSSGSSSSSNSNSSIKQLQYGQKLQQNTLQQSQKSSEKLKQEQIQQKNLPMIQKTKKQQRMNRTLSKINEQVKEGHFKGKDYNQQQLEQADSINLSPFVEDEKNNNDDGFNMLPLSLDFSMN